MPSSGALPPLSTAVANGVSAFSSTATSLPISDAAAPYGIPGSPPPRAFSPDSFEWEEWRGDWPFVLHALAGSFAGVMEHLSMYPIDTLKTRMQAFNGTAGKAGRPNSPPSEASSRGGAAPPARGPSCSSRCGLVYSGGPAASDAANGGLKSGRQLSAAATWGGPARGPGPPVALPVLRPPYTGESAATPFRWIFMNSVTGRQAVSAAAGGPLNYPSWGFSATPKPASSLFSVQQQYREAAQAGGRRLPSLLVDRGGRWPSGGAPMDLRGGGVLSSCGLLRRLREEGSSTMHRRGLAEIRKGEGNALHGFGLLSGLKEVYKEGGVKGLYRGASAVVAGCIPAHACYFMAYELVKERMCARARNRQQRQQLEQQQQQQQEAEQQMEQQIQQQEKLRTRKAALPQTERIDLPSHGAAGAAATPQAEPPPPRRHKGQRDAAINVGTQGLTHGELLACGVCATFSHEVVLTPVDVIKQRMQLGCFSSLRSCVTATLRREGPLAFVRSLPASVLLNLPYGAALVYTNESLKRRLAAGQPSGSLSLPLYFFCAGVSGGVAGLLSNPLDVVKTRLQTQDCAVRESRAPLAGMKIAGPCPLAPCPPKYQSLLGTVKTIWMEEGLNGFWRGVSGRVCLSIPATAICWGSYETFKFIWRASAG